MPLRGVRPDVILCIFEEMPTFWIMHPAELYSDVLYFFSDFAAGYLLLSFMIQHHKVTSCDDSFNQVFYFFISVVR